MSLKEKTINAVLWNSVGKFTGMGIEFIVGIILARVLSPKEFGLIGTIMVVIALAQVFVNSGFSQAIVRKKDCTQTDYSTAFYFNLIVGILLFFILLFAASPISLFFKNQELKPLIQVLGFVLVIGSFTLIQQATLTKKINFKLQTKISIIASFLSGIIAILMAYKGFGVWSLIGKTLTYQGINSILLWYWNRWKPDLVFSRKSFNELFGFGSKLLLSGLITTLFSNINYLIIAKYFSAVELGYFTRAELFKNLASQNVESIASSIGYPVLASIQDDKPRMKAVFRKMFTNTFFIIAVLMAGLAAVAKPLIILLIGEKWLPSVPLLQMLCVVGLFFPLNSMNINILNVVGRSDLYLKLQTVMQIIAIPNIFIGVFFGIKALILGTIALSLIGYLLFNHESSKVLGYSLKEQLTDIFAPLMLAVGMGISVFFLGYLISFNNTINLFIQVTFGILILFAVGEIFKLKEYTFIKNTVTNEFKKYF